MVSVLHEALIELFRTCDSLAVDLLRVNGVEISEGVNVETLDPTFNQISPTEYRADIVQKVLDADGRTLFAVIIEPQLSPDERKKFSWPVYVTSLYARLECPIALLVVTPDPAVEAWALAPIDIWPGTVHRPVVLGPSSVPRIGEGEARGPPELAVLSALAHGSEARGASVAFAAIAALAGLDAERRDLYYDLIMARLPDEARQELFSMMMLAGKKYEYQSEFARRYFAQGLEQGLEQGREKGREEGEEVALRRALLEVLAARGLLDAEARRRVEEETEHERLHAWLVRAATGTSLEEIFQ